MNTYEKIDTLIDKQSNDLKIKLRRILEVHDKSIARTYAAANKTTAVKKPAPAERPTVRKAQARSRTYPADDNYSSDSN
jgi:hypothetical protein